MALRSPRRQASAYRLTGPVVMDATVPRRPPGVDDLAGKGTVAVADEMAVSS